MTAQLVVDIVTDASKAVSGFKKVDQAAAGTASKTQSAGSKIAGFAKVVGGAFAVEKVAEFGKASVEAAQEAAVANDRLVSVFKGAGDASGEAAKHAEEFAESLGKHIGVDPEVIKGGEAILATFHSVSDETGRSAGIFDRATAAAADLAAAGFGDLKSNSVQLGKALEDPVKGMTALAKSGVTFTKAQKAQIKALEESHQHLAAQKVILAAVEGQVKGTAAATATTGQKMSVAWKEAQENIGTALLPAVQKIQTAISGVFNFITANSSWLLPMVAGVAGLAAAIKVLSIGMKLWGDAVKVAKGIQAAWTAATKVAIAIQTAFDIVLDANPVVLIVLAIIALIAGIVLLVIKVKVVRDAMLDAWNAVKGAAELAFKAVLGAILTVWDWLKKNWPLVLAILTGPVGLAVLAIAKNWDKIKAAGVAAFDWLKKNWPLVLAILTGPVGLAVLAIVKNWNTIKGAAAGVYDWLRKTWASVYNFVVAPISAAVNWIQRAFDSLIRWLGGIPAAVGRALSAAYNFVISPFSSAVGWVERAFNSLVGWVGGIPGAIGRALAGVFNAIIRPFQLAFHWINDNILNPLKSVWNTVANTINAVHIKTPGVKVLGHTVVPSFDWRPPFHIPTLASGGVFNKATLAVVGEAGREIVAPEAMLRSIVGGGGQQVNVILNVYVPPTANPAETGREVANTLRSFFRAGGRLQIPA